MSIIIVDSYCFDHQCGLCLWCLFPRAKLMRLLLCWLLNFGWFMRRIMVQYHPKCHLKTSRNGLRPYFNRYDQWPFLDWDSFFFIINTFCIDAPRFVVQISSFDWIIVAFVVANHNINTTRANSQQIWTRTKQKQTCLILAMSVRATSECEWCCCCCDSWFKSWLVHVVHCPSFIL